MIRLNLTDDELYALDDAITFVDMARYVGEGQEERESHKHFKALQRKVDRARERREVQPK